MNICFTSYHSIDPLSGGIERVSYNLAREFIARGHKVVNVYSALKGTPASDCGEHIQLPGEDIFSPGNVEFLHGILEAEGIDIILNQGWSEEFHDLCHAARQGTRAGLVFTEHFAPDAPLKGLRDMTDYIRFAGLGLPRWIIRKLRYPLSYCLTKRRLCRYYRKLYDQSDAYVLLSEGFREVFRSIVRRKDTRKLYAIANPVPAVDPPHGPRKDQVLFVGRMAYVYKRVDRLLEVWNEVWRDYPLWKLVVVGGGSDHAAGQIHRYAEKLGLGNVVFTGTADPQPYYRESKALCMTSTCEGFGMVLVEAQQNGCVPVAYDSFEALGDIIEDDENGFKVKAFDKKAFAIKLRCVMDDEALRERMAEKAIETSTKFDVKTIADQWIDLFEKLLKREQIK